MNASTGALTVASQAALNFETSPSFSLVVKVQDNGSPILSSQATVTISLTDVNELPVISNQSFSVAENSANGTLAGTVVATDPDAGQTKTFSIVSGNTNGAFAINTSTGALTVANSAAINFYLNPTFNIGVKVIDSGLPSLSQTATITINILPGINQPPVITDQSFSVSQNAPAGTSVGQVKATDPNAGQSLVYSIISGNSDGGFAINSATGEITVTNLTVLKTKSVLAVNFIVQVQDNGSGNLSNQANVTVSFTDVNQAPVINNQSFSIAENTPNGTIVETVLATDNDADQTKTFSIISGNLNNAFSINSATGALSVSNSTALNFELNPTFSLIVKVQDNGVGNLSSQATITILLADANEAPVISNQSFSIAENSAIGSAAGTAIATDPDAGQSKVFSIISGNTNNAFAINPTSGLISVANPIGLDFELNPVYNLTVKVEDNGNVRLSSQAIISITLLDVNEAPVITDQTLSVPENSVSGTLVGNVIATDVDASQGKTYSIVSGNTNNAFTINSTTGVLTIASSTALNFETQPSYSLKIKVQDNGIGTLSSQANISVNLADVNEPPVLDNQVISVPKDSKPGTSLGYLKASDPDYGQVVKYKIKGGNESQTFTLDSVTGQLSLVDTIKYLKSSNPLTTLMVSAQDNGPNSLSTLSFVTITIDQAIGEITQIDGLLSDRDVNIYPNPTSDVLNIDFGKVMNQPVKVSIMNMNGQEVYSREAENQDKLSINLENQKPGAYITRISLNGQDIKRKVIVQQ